jgi:hypothetical protein
LSPRRTTQVALSLVAFAASALIAPGKGLTLPRMPLVEFADGPARSANEIRAELEQTLPNGEKLILSGPPPGSASERETRGPESHIPTPTSTITGRFPVLDLADERYGRIKFEFLPVLADWFDALAAAFGHETMELHAKGLSTNKAARLIATFVALRLDRQRGADRGYPPAIGWGRFHFNEAWGRCEAGSVHALMVIATDRGWVLFDPYTRRVRPLHTGDSQLVPEFIVL